MFINLITGANGGGATAGVTSLNDQKGDLKLKTVNSNDLLGEGNIEIQEGMEKVYMAQLDEAGRKEFYDYVKANLGSDGIYHGNKWPYMANGSGTVAATRIGLLSTSQILAHYTDIQNGVYYFEKIVQVGEAYNYKIVGPRPLVSNVSAGTIYISEQEGKTLALNNTDVDVPVDIVIPFTKVNSLIDAIKNGYSCVIKHKTANQNYGTEVTIPATIYSDNQGMMAYVVFDFEGTKYWYLLNEVGTKMSFYRSNPLPNGNINSSEVSNIKVLTQAEYDAIDPKDEKTLYMVKA